MTKDDQNSADTITESTSIFNIHSFFFNVFTVINANHS